IAKKLVHGARRLRTARLAHYPRRDAGNGLVRRNGLQNDRTCSDLAAMTALDIAQDFCARADQHAMADLRVTIFGLLPRTAKGHAVQDRHVILDYGCLTHHEACGVIDEDALADARRWVDVGLEDRGRPALQIEGEVATAPAPQPVRQPMRL